MADLNSVAVRQSLVQELERGQATPSELSARFGITMPLLAEFIQKEQLPSLGRPEDYPFVVSVRRRDSSIWPKQHFLGIQAAKTACDHGRANLTYFHGSEMLVMYSFPTTYRVIRKPWFFGELGAT